MKSTHNFGKNLPLTKMHTDNNTDSHGCGAHRSPSQSFIHEHTSGAKAPETSPLTFILSPLKRGEDRVRGNFICF